MAEIINRRVTPAREVMRESGHNPARGGNSMPKQRITIDLEPELLDWVTKHAEKNFLSRNNVISEAVTALKQSKEVKSMLTWQALEDNGGGLHLAVFSEGACIYFGSGYELNNGRLTFDIESIKDGADVSDWDGNVDDPQVCYDEMKSYEYGWELLADSDGVYPDKMGLAAKREFGIEEEEMTKETFWNELTEENQNKATEMLADYAGSDGVEGRIFELYEEGARGAGVDLKDYLDANDYVSYSYDEYLEKQ